jgi:tetratricopeptide (TPR) repeat protein
MSRRNAVPRARAIAMSAAWAAALACGLVTAAPAAETMRPALGKPLASAEAYLRAHNYSKAMAALREAEAVPGKSASENLVVEEVHAAIAQASGDLAGAASAYQQLLASGVGGGEALKLMQNEVSINYKLKNFQNVVYWADRYIKAGGTEPAMRTYLIAGYFAQGKYAEAERLQAAQIQAETRSGRAPAEDQLTMLYACQTHLKDNAGQLATIKQLVAYYPKRDYWLNVIDNLRSKPGFPDRLTLDVDELEFSLGLVNKPEDAMDMAELAVQAKLPGEAEDVVTKSFAGGLLGTGPDASRHLRLKALVDKTYAADKADLGKEDAAAEADRDGNALLALGQTYVSYGQYDKGLGMMEEAIRKDDLRHPEDAKLHLALAYWAAGKKAQAIAELKTVRGTDGTADLAQLWLLRFRHA